MRLFCLLLLSLFCNTVVFAKQVNEIGYRIQVQINGYSEKELYLAYYLGDKTYIKDTAYATADGKFTFSGKELLPPGVYLIVVKPNNNFLQLLIGKNNQQFSIATTTADFTRDMDVNGSPDNRLLYQYINYLNGRRAEATLLQEAIAKKEADAAEKQKKLDALDKEIKQYQQSLLERYKNTLFASFLQANIPPEQNLPVFTGSSEEINRQAYDWLRARYFQHINLADPFFLRTPLLWERVNSYITKMTVQQPDSVIGAVEEVISKVKPSAESFKFFVVELLNQYAKSNTVGMDKVYVHLAEKYYKTGIANWIEPAQREKIVANAAALRPVLLGVKAPALRGETTDGMQFDLHQFKAAYTVLFFWNPGSANALKQLDALKLFAAKYKQQGVRVVTVCTGKETNLQQTFTAALQQQRMEALLNVLDVNPAQSGVETYNIKFLPQLFVLDSNKTILMKQISTSQLAEVMDNFLKK